ncbi:MAG TPA: 50S ribosomal protein L10 [bacterium]|nr:50S ribosomal protein L10 [bacterium]
MANPRPEKIAMVEELEQRLRGASIVILTDYRGLTVAEIGALRGRLRDANVDYRVAKNTLLALAAERCGIHTLAGFLTGPTAVVFGRDDPGVPARVLQEFIRQYRKLEIKGGVLGGEALGADEVRTLATLPSRGELLARAIGTIQGPLRAVVVMLSAPPRGLVQVLDALRVKREAEQAPGPAVDAGDAGEAEPAAPGAAATAEDGGGPTAGAPAETGQTDH